MVWLMMKDGDDSMKIMLMVKKMGWRAGEDAEEDGVEGGNRGIW